MQKNIKELKSKIFELYKLCREETSRARRQTLFGQLWEQSLRWCKDYLFKYDEAFEFDELFKVEELGEGIFKVIRNLVEMEEEPDDFFLLFNKCLRMERNAIIINEIREKGIKTPRNKTIKVYKIDKYVEYEEEKKKEKLSEDELAVICIQHRMDIHEYKMIKNMNTVRRIEYQSEDTGDDFDILANKINNDDGKKLLDPQEKLISKSSRQIYCDSAKSIIESNHGKKRRCLKALFTLHCYEKNILFEEMDLVLDDKILELCKEAHPKKVTDKEVYMIYNPIKSAGESASRLKKENPELFL